MSNSPILTQLRNEWARLSRCERSRDAAQRLDRRHPDLSLEHVVDMGDVISLLDGSSRLSVIAKSRIVTALLEEANDLMIRRALFQTLLPGVVSVCRSLRFGDGVADDPSETLGVALALLSELLVDWAGQTRTFCAPDILSALRGRLRRWLLNEKQARALANSTFPESEATYAPSTLLTRLDGFRGGPHERLARLTYARVFEGRSLDEVANADKSSPGRLQAELRQFAFHHLL
jgi:hypothetical protein